MRFEHLPAVYAKRSKIVAPSRAKRQRPARPARKQRQPSRATPFDNLQTVQATARKKWRAPLFRNASGQRCQRAHGERRHRSRAIRFESSQTVQANRPKKVALLSSETPAASEASEGRSKKDAHIASDTRRNFANRPSETLEKRDTLSLAKRQRPARPANADRKKRHNY